jgi:hypothetical protein
VLAKLPGVVVVQCWPSDNAGGTKPSQIADTEPLRVAPGCDVAG